MKCFKIIACLFFLLVINLTFSIADSFAVCLDPPSGIVSWWPGDGNALDIIGPNDGTLINGTTFASGKVDQAFSFDGVDDSVQASVTGIKDLQQLTIDAWVMHNSLPVGQIQRYVTLADKAVLRFDGINGPQQLDFYMRIDGVLHHIRVNDVLQVGVFHHVAGTYNGEYMRLYLDGVEVKSLAVSGTVAPAHWVEFGFESVEAFDGLLDEVEIYDRALSASEILAIYNADSEGKCKSFGDWQTVYNTLFENPPDLELFRQYRDKILSNTTKGVIYKTLLYTVSKQALQVLLSNPNFIFQAKVLIDANIDAVRNVLNGNGGVISNTSEIVAFLDTYAKKSPLILKIFSYIARWDMLRKQKRGDLFFGFRLK